MTDQGTIYTRNNCQPCLASKSLLTKLGVDYREVNTDESPGVADQLRREGWKELPVVVTEWADDSWSGFRPDKIKALVK